MSNDKSLTSLIIRRTIIFFLIVIGLMLIFIKNAKPYILGFVFGTIISILGFKLIEKSVEKAITMEPSKAYAYTIVQYLIRYIIYALVLIIAAIADYLSFISAVLGLLMIKIVIISSAFKRSVDKDR